MDPASGTNPDGSSRFVDPDEQIHSSFFRRVGPVNEDGWADQNSPSRNFSSGADGRNQGITFPNVFFPTFAAPAKSISPPRPICCSHEVSAISPTVLTGLSAAILSMAAPLLVAKGLNC